MAAQNSIVAKRRGTINVGCLVLAVLLLLPVRLAGAGENAIVISPDNKLNLRAAPYPNADILRELPNNTKVHILFSLDNDWKRIAVDILGDTGRPPEQALFGFVNGRYLTRDSVIAASAFRDGHADRQAWENWFSRLSDGPYRVGAEFWATHRSEPNSPDCSATDDVDYRSGCEEAKKRLDNSDRRRKTEADYKSGWNSPLDLATEMVPTPPRTPEAPQPTAVSAHNECDDLAAHPSDKGRPAGIAGVPMDKIDPDRAIAACERAVQIEATARTFFQLGRALEAGKNYEDAFRNYQIAAEHGYAEAAFNLGFAYEKGQGVSRDPSEAEAWYHKAADGGSSRGRDALERMSKESSQSAVAGGETRGIVTLVCSERRGPQYHAKIVLDLSRQVVVSQESGVIDHGINMPFKMTENEIMWPDGGYLYVIDRTTLEMRGEFGGSTALLVIYWDCQLAGERKF